MTLLETTFLIDLLRGLPEAITKSEALETTLESKTIATPSILEIWFGAVNSNRSEHEKKKVSELISMLAPLPLDVQSAMAAGEIYGELIKSGERIDPEDCMIAAIARTHNETILTRNTKHYRNIKGIRIETY